MHHSVTHCSPMYMYQSSVPSALHVAEMSHGAARLTVVAASSSETIQAHEAEPCHVGVLHKAQRVMVRQDNVAS